VLDVTGPVRRVDATPAAVALIDRLVGSHGPVLFHQSGGCCDGSAPMCYPRGELQVGDSDVLLGWLPDASASPFYMWRPQYDLWAHTHLTVDVVAGRGSGFSLEAPEGVRFVVRSRLFTDDEVDAMDRARTHRAGTDRAGTDRAGPAADVPGRAGPGSVDTASDQSTRSAATPAAVSRSAATSSGTRLAW
jgi:uncharacterized protein (DUF779 family)